MQRSNFRQITRIRLQNLPYPKPFFTAPRKPIAPTILNLFNYIATWTWSNLSASFYWPSWVLAFFPQSPLKVPLKPRAAVETSPRAIILLVKWNSKWRTLGIIEGTRVTETGPIGRLSGRRSGNTRSIRPTYLRPKSAYHKKVEKIWAENFPAVHF